uniref:hypothetical protein n=1 Tax=Agarivorans sp. TaxID=1872412 RepID=UPI003D088654
NRELFTDSFLYDPDGEPRTWYVVWADNSVDYPEWTLEEFSFVDDSDLMFRAEPGGLLALTRPGGESICFEGGYCTDTVMLPLSEFDAEAGSFVTYFGSETNYFFQTQAEAQAKLEQLLPATEVFTIDFILDADATAADFEGWGIHLWNFEDCNAYPEHEYAIPLADWFAPIMPTSIEAVGMGLYGEVIGARFELPVYVDAGCANFIIHKENDKAYEADMMADIGEYQHATVTYGQEEIVYSME